MPSGALCAPRNHFHLRAPSQISTPGQDTREDRHATADTPGAGQRTHGQRTRTPPKATRPKHTHRPRPPTATHPSGPRPPTLQTALQDTGGPAACINASQTRLMVERQPGGAAQKPPPPGERPPGGRSDLLPRRRSDAHVSWRTHPRSRAVAAVRLPCVLVPTVRPQPGH